MIDGFFIVDKPAGMTSHDVVARIRRTIKQKRVGHAGTLDPNATGVLLVAVGRATRLMRFVSGLTKSYTCEVVLGTTTTTLDADGEVTGTWDMSHISDAELRRVAQIFVGDIEQIPPMVSAVKVGGRRLHELSREGIEVERKPRPVAIYSISVDRSKLSVSCSSGTYIRTLVSDIGTELGGGAHLKNLVRSAIGDFDLDVATPLSELENDYLPHLLRPVTLLKHLDTVEVDTDSARAIAHGCPLQLDLSGNGPWALHSRNELLGVYERGEDRSIKASVVLSGH